ncbi:MAG: hypothetical protein AB7V77_01930 [Candidatus Woesearchaeota archaeon]
MKKILSLIVMSLLLVSMAFATSETQAKGEISVMFKEGVSEEEAINLITSNELEFRNNPVFDSQSYLLVLVPEGKESEWVSKFEMEEIVENAKLLYMESRSMISAESSNENSPEVTGNEESNGIVEPIQIMEQVQQRLRDGTYAMEGGQQLQIREHMGEMQFQVGNMVANTKMQMMQEMVGNATQLRAQLSNGRNAEIKIMPAQASENALRQLRMRVCLEEEGCQIQLKEMVQNGEPRAAYQIQAEKEARVLGLFKTRMRVNADVDAETGEVINTGKPWWAFLASEKDEEPITE